MTDPTNEPPTDRLLPPSSDLTDAFWDATRSGTYLVQWCAPCGEPIFHPREVCPRCLASEGLHWRPSSGRGTVHAVSVQHRPGNPTMVGRVPYAVVLVDLDAGGGDAGADDGDGDGDGDGAPTVRIMANVVDGDPHDVAVGDPVVLAWEPLADGRQLAVFVRGGATADAE